MQHQGELVFKDKEGNIINDEDTVLATGMTLQVGTTLNFTISVVQDVNGDGNVSITDLAQIVPINAPAPLVVFTLDKLTLISTLLPLLTSSGFAVKVTVAFAALTFPISPITNNNQENCLKQE